MLIWKRGIGVSLSWVYVHSSICETYLVMWYCIDLLLIRGGVVGSLPWVYVHSAIYETYMVQWYSRDICLIGDGLRSVCPGYMCILLYFKLIWCSCVA